MLRPLILTALVLVCVVASAQPTLPQSDRLNQPAVPLGRMHGTWFNARFIDELNGSRSLTAAMSKVRASDPLWVRIDSAQAAPFALVGFNVNRIDTMQIRKQIVKGAGQKWVIGHSEQPLWMVADDEIGRSYIAMTLLDSLDAEPLVMGALPSKNPDPMFILRRMVNNSLLVGRWKRSDGKEVRFSNDQVMTVGEESVRYNMSFQQNGTQLRITTIDGQPLTWSVDRQRRQLRLRPAKGDPVVLTPLP